MLYPKAWGEHTSDEVKVGVRIRVRVRVKVRVRVWGIGSDLGLYWNVITSLEVYTHTTQGFFHYG